MSAALPPDAPDVSGTQYVLERLLGEGGFGQAYLAYNNGLRRRCVLKVLTDVDNPGFVARFYREAQVMANLEHPTIPRVYEVATTKQGAPYFVMEFVDGKSLGEHLADEGGTLPIAEAARLVADAAEGLAAAHEMGVIHRDVKLANLLVNKRGHIKVIDFGIAQKTLEDGDGAGAQLFGTPRYMSPEQAIARPIGPASDFYALGVVLFILLTGQSPFEGTALEMMNAHVREPAPRLSEIAGVPFPPAMEALVARLLAKDPTARYARGDELAADLRIAGGVGEMPKKIAAPTRPFGIASTADRDLATASRAQAVSVPASSSPRRTDLRLGEAVRRALVIEPSIAVPVVVADVPETDLALAKMTRPEDLAQTERALAPIPDYDAATEPVGTPAVAAAPDAPKRTAKVERVVIRPPARVTTLARNERTPSALQTSVAEAIVAPRNRAPLLFAIGLAIILGMSGAIIAMWPRGNPVVAQTVPAAVSSSAVTPASVDVTAATTSTQVAAVSPPPVIAPSQSTITATGAPFKPKAPVAIAAPIPVASAIPKPSASASAIVAPAPSTAIVAPTPATVIAAPTSTLEAIEERK